MDVATPEPGWIILDASLDLSELSDLAKVAPGVAVVGCRGFSEASAQGARRLGVQLYPVRALLDDLGSACDGLMEFAREWPRVVLDIRARVLDPAFVKVDDPSHGGLQPREVFYLIERLKLLRNFGGGRVELPEGDLKEQLERALEK